MYKLSTDEGAMPSAAQLSLYDSGMPLGIPSRPQKRYRKILIPAGTGIHRRNQHEARRIRQADGRPGDGDRVILQRLAQRFDSIIIGRIPRDHHGPVRRI